MRILVLVSLILIFSCISYSTKPVEKWVLDHKKCVYSNCDSEICLTRDCIDCSKNCKKEETTGYHETLLCLKSCKEGCSAGTVRTSPLLLEIYCYSDSKVEFPPPV